MMNALPALAGLMFLALPAAAAGPAAGIPAAREAAELRLAGAELVEIEGFAGTDGDIPCSRSSYSNSWHYKFYSAGEWMLVNACGPNFINAAKDRPYSTAGLPVKSIPPSFASAAEVLKKLAEDGVFVPAPNKFDRDVLMNIRYLPASGGRPEGCYWSVSQGRTKALADCAGEKTWKLGGAAAGGGKTAPAPGPAAKNIDSAGKYRALALSTVRRKYPQAVLMSVESLVDRNGGAKCIGTDSTDGWYFTFYHPTSFFNACKGKTFLSEGDFTGKSNSARDFSPMPDQFIDSSEALLKLPASCVKAHATLLMRLHKFKPGLTPIAGHNFMWITDCGSFRYYVDAQTGKYVGGGQK